jgi:hypothetical protein
MISPSVICRAPTPSSSGSTSAVAEILITRAPRLIWYRAAFTTSSTPSAIPIFAPGRTSDVASPVRISGSMCPPGMPIACPAATTRGASIRSLHHLHRRRNHSPAPNPHHPLPVDHGRLPHRHPQPHSQPQIQSNVVHSWK